MLKAAILLIISMSTACAVAMSLNQSTFFSAFSLRSLVGRTASRSGLDCSSGGTGGGIGTGYGGVGRKESRRHKGESLTCRVKSGAGEPFSEAEYIATLREAVEKDITASGAKISDGESVDTNGFFYEYGIEKTSGRIEITGKRVGADHYSLKASLDEVEIQEE